MYKIFEFIINKMNNNNNQYIFEICGSYRREKITSNDIDILISNKNNYSNINHLNYFVELLKQPIKLNNNQPLLIDDLTSKNYKTKYMGFIKYKDNLIRRLDIRYVSWDSYYTALLYFTGSAEFNQKIRKNAHELGYKLSEYNLIKIDTNTKININSENDIFNILNINYISPKFR
jgi:DNA polymerase/3'-5' exonuclease PolX